MTISQKQQGLTLIELLVAVSIVAILAIVAVTIYSAQIRTSRRTDAINTLFAIALAQESYRTTNPTYGTLAQVWNGVTSSVGGYYSLAITNIAAGTYTLTATALGDQANDAQNGTSCTVLIYAMNNGTSSPLPAVCWPA